MAIEEPKGRLDVELSAHLAFSIGAACLGNALNPVEHQQGRQRQLGVAGAEQLAPAASQEILVVEAVTPVIHLRDAPFGPGAKRTANPGVLVSQAPAHRKRGAAFVSFCAR